MIKPNTINKIKNFANNRRDIGYRFEPPSGNNLSVIILGEKHTDPIERKDQEDLIKELGLAKFVLLAEDEGYFKSWKGKYGCCEVLLCDLDLYINPKASHYAREKEMGEIIRRNHSIEPPKPIVVIIGHYHARKDSEVHKILEKEEIDHICIWNEKAVEEVKERYQFFRRNSAQDRDMRL